MKKEFSLEYSWLLTRMNRMRKRYMSSKLADIGLGGSLYMYMLAINRNPGASQDYLVCHFCADKGNVARAVKKLEDEGYIRREPDPSDRRQNCLYLTPKGDEAMQVIFKHLGEWTDELTVGFTDDELRVARELMTRMAENVGGVKPR